MKRVCLALVALAAAVAASVGIAPAHAGAVVTQIPYHSVESGPCSGERVEITGTLVVVERDNGYTVTLANGRAVAVLTGARYVIAQTAESASHGDSGGLPAVTTIGIHVRWIRLGEDASFVPGDDFMLDLVVRFTRNADGYSVADVLHSETSCF